MGTIVVTGGSDGIGAAAALQLTQMGHEVLITGRSREKLGAVHTRLVAAAPVGVVVPDPISADLSSLDEVRRLAALLLERCPRVDVLVNNAGLMGRRRETSVDGFELVFAVNHLAPFLLTNLLLERLQASDGRVITTSSGQSGRADIDFDDLQRERKWRALQSYGGSKLANVWFTSELARRTAVPATCFFPGPTSTHLARNTPLGDLLMSLARVFTRSPEEAAGTLTWLSTDPEGAHPRAVCYEDRKPAKVSSRGQDTVAAARLWDVSAVLVGLVPA
jgi:NAD(P)-dependent dehydrogenase (short-subunit alcohol dehydrogenase family)